MKRETLIILSPGFPANESESTCLPSIQNFIKTLNAGFPLIKIVVLAFDYPFTSVSYQWNNNTVYSFNGFKKRKINKLLKWIFIWRKLNTIRRNTELIGLLSFWCDECAFIGSRYAKKYHLKHLCWILGQDAKKENRYVRRMKPHPNELIALSDFIQKTFKLNHGIQPWQIIPFGIDATAFPAENIEKDIDILGAGSLIALKQYEAFVEVINRLKDHIPRIKTVLCGKGPEEKKLIALINKYGLQKNIILMGELPHSSVLKYMKRSKVFLHPSSYEGFGIVCIEALCAGMSVISFCKPMDAEIKNWYHLNTNEEMIQKAIALLTNPHPDHSSVVPFTMMETVNKIMQLYGYKETASC